MQMEMRHHVKRWPMESVSCIIFVSSLAFEYIFTDLFQTINCKQTRLALENSYVNEEPSTVIKPNHMAW